MAHHRDTESTLGCKPQKIWVDEIFLALHYPALATICGGQWVRQPLYMERRKSLTERLNVACKRSQGRGQIGPTAGLLNETNAFKDKTKQDQIGN